MNKHYIYFLFALVSNSVIWGQSLSFDEALSQMRQSNQKLKGVEKQTEAADYNRKSFRGLYLPQLSLNASYMHLSDPLYLSFNDYKAPIQNGLQGFATQVPAPIRPLFAPLLGRVQPLFAQDWRYKFQEQDIWKVSADAKWVLFAGGKVRVGNRVSALNTEIATVETKKPKMPSLASWQNVIFNVS